MDRELMRYATCARDTSVADGDRSPITVIPASRNKKEQAMKTISIIKVQKIALTRTLAAYYECCMNAQ